MALRTVAETMTGAIHFVPWPKPSRVDQFCIVHVLSFPHAEAEMLELCIPELHQLRSLGMRPRAKAASSGLQEPHLGGVHGSILLQAAKFVSGLRCIAGHRPSR
jgi:hypothetical protein